MRSPVNQLEHLGARGHAVRRLQAVGLRPRARPARTRRLHRGQVDLLRHLVRLQGKVCVITGAAGGIGAATAALFQREGAKGVGADVAEMGAATSQISYTASKGGVLALSRELGIEFAHRGVRVNALCPGPVDTPLLRELFAKDPEQAARRLVHVPMGRFARAEEIAHGALFLASDESSFVTASTFLVDGGISGAYVTPE